MIETHRLKNVPIFVQIICKFYMYDDFRYRQGSKPQLPEFSEDWQVANFVIYLSLMQPLSNWCDCCTCLRGNLKKKIYILKAPRFSQ